MLAPIETLETIDPIEMIKALETIDPIEILIAASSSIVLSMIGSKWIDRLYAREEAPLSFPDELESRRRFRLPLLSIGLFVCLISIVGREPLEIFFLSSAAFLLLSITATDFEQYVIFDRMNLTLALAGLIASFVFDAPLIDRLTASLVGGGVFFLIALASKGALGGGDIKLIAALGLWLGSAQLLETIVYGSIAGGLAAFLMLATKKMNRKSFFAYGPYFALTALIILLSSAPLARAADLPVTSSFGWRVHPISGEWKFHAGVDLGYEYGSGIISLFDGQVLIAEDLGDGYGYQVLVYHPSLDAYTRYAHCSRLLTRVGALVRAGEIIAAVGSTGYSTGPHLHLEYIVRDGDHYVYADPLSLWQ